MKETETGTLIERAKRNRLGHNQRKTDAEKTDGQVRQSRPFAINVQRLRCVCSLLRAVSHKPTALDVCVMCADRKLKKQVTRVGAKLEITAVKLWLAFNRNVHGIVYAYSHTHTPPAASHKRAFWRMTTCAHMQNALSNNSACLVSHNRVT